MNQDLTIIIPAFNEAINFKAGKLQQVADYLKKNNLDWEVLVVEDGSSDGSNVAIAKWVSRQSRWQFIQNPHQGKAATVMAGVVAASKKYLLFTDFDQATPIGEVEKLLPFINKGYQVVIGSREVKGSLRAKEPMHRHLMCKVFNLLVQIVALQGIQDTQCGFKIFDAKIAKNLFNQLRVYRPRPEKHAFTGAFDVELLFLAQKQGLKVAEVPISWYHTATNRVNPVRDSILMFLDVLKIRMADLAGMYR